MIPESISSACPCYHGAMQITVYTRHPSPVGSLLIAGDGHCISTISFGEKEQPALPRHDWVESSEPFAEARRQLDAYFARELTEFDLPLKPNGTRFQRQVWAALQTIPYGQTCSYGDIANAIGNPGASRAVGAANNANPVTIVIPCHRVIGASGELVGYGGGLARKQQLLEIERAECVAALSAHPVQQSLFDWQQEYAEAD